MKDQVLHITIPNNAAGYKIVNLEGWKGECLIIPRTELGDIDKRPEIRNPGIYFLFGEEDESNKQKLYIGESERFFDRLQTHDANKNFWNTAIVFTGGLDKAKIKYLEFLSTNEAKKVNRYDLLNDTKPNENSLESYDKLATNNYFSRINYILTALKYPVFQAIRESIKDDTIYYIKSRNSDARAELLNDGSLNVLKNSIARKKETESFTGWSLSARDEFLKDGTMKENDAETYIFTRDVLFKSPSAAAATITGSSINGWDAWKDELGNTLDQNVRK